MVLICSAAVNLGWLAAGGGAAEGPVVRRRGGSLPKQLARFKQLYRAGHLAAVVVDEGEQA